MLRIASAVRTHACEKVDNNISELATVVNQSVRGKHGMEQEKLATISSVRSGLWQVNTLFFFHQVYCDMCFADLEMLLADSYRLAGQGDRPLCASHNSACAWTCAPELGNASALPGALPSSSSVWTCLYGFAFVSARQERRAHSRAPVCVWNPGMRG